jgi:uncharacterized protein YfiM (DUF2279 family)
MRFLFAGLALCLLCVIALPAVVLFSAMQDSAWVEATPSARQDDVARLKTLLSQHDPRSLRDGEVRALTVSERDLNIALRSMLPGLDRQRMRVALTDGFATLYCTLAGSGSGARRYLNYALVLQGRESGVVPLELRAGDVRLPGWVLTPLVALADFILERQFTEYRGAREALQSVAIRPGEVEVSYRFDRQLAQQLEERGRAVLLPADDRERALVYYRELARVSRQVGPRASLSQLLQPLFETARRRSGRDEAAAENRALLLVLGTVLNRSSVHRLVGGNPADLGQSHYYVRWTLYGRQDLALHFGISAAIAAAGGSVLADAIGAYKELDDSRGGSGFSFIDLLADRAGVELAVAATGEGAERVQGVMASSELSESDFMPAVTELPEGLMELEFNQRYRDLDDRRYGYVKREIDTRIAMLPLHGRG